jgi:putative glutamine amidotransferase
MSADIPSYRPTIGLTTQTLHSIDGIPPALPSSWVMNQRYFHAATAAGAVPWMIPLLDDDLPTLRAIYERLDGVLIPGGVDINPAEYGESVRPECGNLDPARDLVELQLVRWAIAEGKPVLGLCRGLQIINVSQGGTMWQDLASQNSAFHKHDFFPTAGFERDHIAHEVTVVEGSRLSQMLDCVRCPVNSMHHQGIKTLGRDLLVSATADDGLIEAIEGRNDGFCIGVQWHPEVFEMTDPQTRQLFGAFIDAAATWSAANQPVSHAPRVGVGAP